MLLVHLVLFTVSETRSSKIPELQEGDMAEHRHALTIHELQSADPHLVTINTELI